MVVWLTRKDILKINQAIAAAFLLRNGIIN